METSYRSKRSAGERKENTDNGPLSPQGMRSCSVLLEALGSSFNEVVGRKSGGKRSFYRPNESDCIVDLKEYDVEKEKEELRKEEAVKEAKEKQGSVLTSHTHFNVLNTLSADEIENHYSTCIKLCSQNKVNSKNAFKLQLIDYMKFILSKRSKKTENLSLMSCTLDASAKIYSYRVDKVYSDMLKIMSFNEGKAGKGKGHASGSEGEGEDSDDEEGSGKRKGKLRKGEEADPEIVTKRRASAFEPHESTDRDPLSDPKFKAEWEKVLGGHSSFQRSKIEEEFYCGTLPKGADYFLECPLSADNRLMLDVSLFCQEKVQHSDTAFKWPAYEGDLEENDYTIVLPGYVDIVNKFHMIDSENRVPQDVPVEIINAYNPSVDISEYTQIVEDADCFEDDFDNDNGDNCALSGGVEEGFDNWHAREGTHDDDNNAGLLPSMAEVEPVIDSLPPAQTHQPSQEIPLSMTGSKSTSMMLTRSAQDSRVLRHCRFDYWGGPKDWKVKVLPNRECVKKTERKYEKKTKFIEFTSEAALRCSKEFISSVQKQADYKLSKKTIANWERYSYPPEVEDLQKNLFSFFNCKSIRIIKNKRDQKETEKESLAKDGTTNLEMVPEEGLTENARVAGEDEVDDCEHREADLFNCSDNGGGDNWDNDELEITESKNHMNESLLPIPHKVEKINVKYAKIQKRIDIKLVKETLWNLLKPEEEDKENVYNKTLENLTARNGMIFQETFNLLKEKLPPETSCELSLPIAFMSLLHLANEKNLRLVPSETVRDISITVDSPTKKNLGEQTTPTRKFIEEI